MIYDAHMFGVIIDTREIFVTPGMESDMIDFTVAYQFICNLRLLNSIGSGTILVHMITCGGDWNYGMAMYDAIKESCDDPKSSDIICLSYAHARSMSSIIPQAATWRILQPHADYLVHYGEYADEGNFTNVMAGADWYKKSNETMMKCYSRRMIYGEFAQKQEWGEDKIIRWLRAQIDKKQEFYMTPQEAVFRGFADGILGDMNTEGCENIEALRK